MAVIEVYLTNFSDKLPNKDVTFSICVLEESGGQQSKLEPNVCLHQSEKCEAQSCKHTIYWWGAQ